ncbi:hypothetical protein C1646_755615 [Rhizophagus diaphanus]|nr:hypothetical protein C1646_755615 [Rhizophagus diaphanus] [Rhizophagus sp. MUCL 43196]
MIIDWSEVETSESPEKSQYIIKSALPPSSSSSSFPSPSPFPSSPSPSSSFSSLNLSFLHYEEIDRDLRTALRNEIARIMDRLPEDKALNTRKTFDSHYALFLRNYVDNAASNARRVKKRVYDTEYAPNEDSAPINAPKWAKVGYKGLLKHLVEKYSANREEEDNDKSQEDDDKIQEDNDKSQKDDDTTGGEKNEDQEKEQDEEVDDRKKRKKRSVSLVSEEYDSSE